MKLKAFKKGLIIISTLTFFSGCVSTPLDKKMDDLFFGTYRVMFPAGSDISDFDKYDVDQDFHLIDTDYGTNKFSIGSYRVVVDRSLGYSQSSSFKLFGTSAITSKENYTFNIKGPENYSCEGLCYAKAETLDQDKQGLIESMISDDSGFVESHTLQCSFKLPGNKNYELNMSEPEDNIKSGEIKGNKIRLKIESTVSTEGRRSNAGKISGYFISHKDRVVAVVDLLNEGVIYILSSADKEIQNLAMSGSVALLFYHDL